MKGRLLLIGLLILLIAGAVPFFARQKDDSDRAPAGELPPASQENIRVIEPEAGDAIGPVFLLRGEARTFESTVNFRVRDEDGTILLEDFTTAATMEIGTFGPFAVDVSYRAPKGTRGTVEVFEYSAADGSELHTVSIPVMFEEGETETVRVFFSNATEDPNMLACEVTYPVERRVLETSDLPRRAILELLRGVTGNEQQEGFFTSINPGVALLDLTMEEGIATVDFDALLQFELGGSCRVSAIRSQIENTLKQFPEVTEVVIAIEGETEGVLEP